MNHEPFLSKKRVRFLYTALLAVLGGCLFRALHIPIPWLLGSMVFVLIGSRFITRIRPYWPGVGRNIGMGIIGYTIGLSFTMATLREMGLQLPFMALLTALLLLCTAVIAFFVSKLSGHSFPTVLLGSIPGGLSQMIPLAEEIEGVDLTVVTFLQISRLMMIIFIVPLLVFSPLFQLQGHALPAAVPQAAADWGGLLPHIWLFAAVCIACALLANKVKFPTAFLLGPMIGTIALSLLGFHGPALPSIFLNFSQVMLGGYIGLLLKPDHLQHKMKTGILAILSGVVLILCSIGLSLLLSRAHAVTFITAFLSLSPGGMDQMAIIAKEVDADLTNVICYQLFRTLFIFLAVPSLLRLIFLKMMPGNGAEARSSATRH